MSVRERSSVGLRLLVLASLACAPQLVGCAPAGLVESTANVIDEMTAFRDARKANTRQAWQSFVRNYPESSKAAMAKKWLQAMPDTRTDAAAAQRELARAESERAERRRIQEEVAQKEKDRLAEAARAAAEEHAQAQAATEAEKAKQAAALAQAQQSPVAVSSQAAAMFAELQRRLDELDKREAALKAKEAAMAAAAAAPAVSADDIDAIPKKGLPPNDENFAIVIGIDKYRDIAAGAEYAERDARTMMLYLRDYLGYPEQNIKLLTGDRASRSDFAKVLELWLPLQVTNESKVFIYYSGHGAPDPNSQLAYLLPYDGDPKALELTAYPIKRLYEKLSALPAKEVTVALDSCFSGAGGRSVIAQGARPLMSHIQTGLVDPRKNLTVFTAASGEEITGAFDAEKHGLFTYYFLRGLRGDADENKDGWVDVSEEYSYLKKNVSRQANRDSREQTPQLLPDLGSRRDKGALKLAKPE